MKILDVTHTYGGYEQYETQGDGTFALRKESSSIRRYDKAYLS